MFRDLLSNRLIQVGLVFFVIGVGGSLLYSWQAQRTLEKELARHDRFLPGIKHNETRPADTVNDPTENATPVKQVPDTADATPTVGDPPKNRADMQQEPSVSAGVSDMEAEIIAEEEKAEEALTAEELEKLKIGTRVREIHSEILDILTAAGGKLHSTTHPEEIRQILHLQQEQADLMKQVSNGPDPEGVSMFAYLTQLGMMSNNATNANGEMLAAEAYKLADYMESVGRDVQGAIGVRMLADVALENGDDAIRPEHYERLHQKMAEIERLLEDEEHR